MRPAGVTPEGVDNYKSTGLPHWEISVFIWVQLHSRAVIIIINRGESGSSAITFIF